MNVHPLNKDNLSNYLHFTFPKYQKELLSHYNEENYMVFGATDGFFPIGLIIARIQQDKAHLLSIYVQDDYRKQGLGSTLYIELEKGLISRGVKEVSLEYMAEKKASPYLEKILKKNQFDEPKLNMTFLYFDYENLTKPKWVREFSLPKKYKIFNLFEMTEKDKKDYSSIKNMETFPKELEISYDFPLAKEASFGLRVDDQFVGWMTTHFIEDSLLRYSCLYVTDKYLARGGSIGLITHTIREHYRLFHKTKPRALFGIRYDYPSMHRMVMRKFAPYASSIQKGMSARKGF
ncbi:MAG: hypothetical protein S4CHLAM37_07690 [Chlamydiia bacterium]|nr:hypothetical protein [Chlamydiia bacterium]